MKVGEEEDNHIELTDLEIENASDASTVINVSLFGTVNQNVETAAVLNGLPNISAHEKNAPEELRTKSRDFCAGKDVPVLEEGFKNYFNHNKATGNNNLINIKNTSKPLNIHTNNDHFLTTSIKEEKVERDSSVIGEEIDKENTSPFQNLEDLCDASTVINFSCHKPCTAENDLSTIATVNDLLDPVTTAVNTEEEFVSVVQKVEAWLNFQHVEQDQKTVCVEESDWWVLEDWTEQDLQASSSIKNVQLRVFLVAVLPDPFDEPLDLVSGYCHSSCRGFTKFSEIHWLDKDDKSFPLCPKCFKSDTDNSSEVELLLMFLVKLKVLDGCGTLETLNLCREPAEIFFSCSVVQFLKNEGMRMNIIESLKELTICKDKSSVPVLEISVVFIKKLLFVVNTKLKLKKAMQMLCDVK